MDGNDTNSYYNDTGGGKGPPEPVFWQSRGCQESSSFHPVQWICNYATKNSNIEPLVSTGILSDVRK